MDKSQIKSKTVKQLKALCKSKGIKGYSKMKKAELIKKCLNKRSKKGGGILNKKIRKSRFLVSQIPPKAKAIKKKRPKVTFADTMTVVSIPENDCPKKNRPRLRKVKLTDTEKKEDIKYLGRARRKKYKLLCSNPNHNINTKKSGFKCCSRFKVENIKD
jgi:hypothetical protein